MGTTEGRDVMIEIPTDVRVQINRSQASLPSWYPVLLDGAMEVYLVCGSCGERGPLVGHRVSSMGVVIPSVICPDCGWHATIRLQNWPGFGNLGRIENFVNVN